MTFWVAGAAVVAAGVGAYSSNKASKAQKKSANEANELAKQTSNDQISLQREMFNKNVELQQPAIEAGNTSRNRLMQLMGLSAGGADNGSLMRDFSMADFQADPGYQFRQDQGQQALERGAAARGGLLSGAASKDMARFSQGLASQEYGAAFDRFNVNRSNKMNPLLSLADKSQVASGALGSSGQSFANSAGNALGNYANTAGQNIIGAANARASGYLAQGNQLTGLLNQGASIFSRNSSSNTASGAGAASGSAPAGTFYDGYGYVPYGSN